MRIENCVALVTGAIRGIGAQFARELVVRLPLLGGKQSSVRENGRMIFADGHAAQSDPGLTVGEADDETLTLTAGSGDYTFTVAPPRTPFTRLALTTGTPAAITAGGSGDIPMVVEAGPQWTSRRHSARRSRRAGP